MIVCANCCHSIDEHIGTDDPDDGTEFCRHSNCDCKSYVGDGDEGFDVPEYA